MRLVSVGGGNMGGAILSALVKTGVVIPEDILLIEQDTEKRQNLSNVTGCVAQATLDETAKTYDLFLLAVKPQGAKSVLEDLAPLLLPEQVIVSVMAGISIQTMRDILGQPKLVRVMPNTPAQIAEGMSVFFASDEVKAEEREWVKTLFSACGACLEAKTEEAIDAATAISGSGPAYLFYLAEQMTASAQMFGFSAEDAQELTQKTIRGAVLLWESQKKSPEILRRQVTSSGGTTEAAINFFEEKGAGLAIRGGIRQAYQRALQIADKP